MYILQKFIKLQDFLHQDWRKNEGIAKGQILKINAFPEKGP